MQRFGCVIGLDLERREEYPGSDYAADAAAIAADPATRQWWTQTDPCQVRLPGTPESEHWATMTEAWHLD